MANTGSFALIGKSSHQESCTYVARTFRDAEIQLCIYDTFKKPLILILNAIYSKGNRGLVNTYFEKHGIQKTKS